MVFVHTYLKYKQEEKVCHNSPKIFIWSYLVYFAVQFDRTYKLKIKTTNIVKIICKIIISFPFIQKFFNIFFKYIILDHWTIDPNGWYFSLFTNVSASTFSSSIVPILLTHVTQNAANCLNRGLT